LIIRLALVAIVFALMSVAFRLGNHFDFSDRLLTIFGALWAQQT